MTYSNDWKKQIVATPYGDFVRIIGTHQNRSIVVCDNIQDFEDAELILLAPKMREQNDKLNEKIKRLEKAVQYSKNCFYNFGADEHLKELESILEGK